MSHHEHEHHTEHLASNAACVQTRASHVFASVVSLGIAGGEAVFGIRHGNTALVVEACHNIGDAGAYIINAVISWCRGNGRVQGAALRARQVAAGMVCAGVVAGGGKAAHELATHTGKTGWADVAVAAAAGVGNYAIRRRFDAHAHSHGHHGYDPETQDSHRHAVVDARMSVLMVGGLGVAAAGVDGAEQVTAIAAAGYTMQTLNPWTGVHRP